MSPASACAVPPQAKATARTMPIDSPVNHPALIMLSNQVVRGESGETQRGGVGGFDIH